MQAPRVILVTDLAVVPEAELLSRIAAAGALPPELRARLMVQLREPDLDGKEKAALGARLRAATRAVGASLAVNDRLDIAMLLEADAVHLGHRSIAVADARALMPTAFITRACHTAAEVFAAAAEGANGALLSPIFASPGKGPPIGLAALEQARQHLDALAPKAFSLYALGGITATNAPACLTAGAHGIALIRANLGPSLAIFLAIPP